MKYKLYDEVYEVLAVESKYVNNDTLAILLETKEGEPFIDLTTNIAGQVRPAESRKVWIENEKSRLDFIKENDLGTSTGGIHFSGYKTYIEYEIREFLKEELVQWFMF